MSLALVPPSLKPVHIVLSEATFHLHDYGLLERGQDPKAGEQLSRTFGCYPLPHGPDPGRRDYCTETS